MELFKDRQLLHNLAFLYFAIGYGADRDLDETELAAIKERLAERYPDLDHEVITEAVSSALEDYMDADDPFNAAADAVVAVRDRLPEMGRRLIYSDLEHVAEADGKVVADERELLDALRDGWDIKQDQPEC